MVSKPGDLWGLTSGEVDLAETNWGPKGEVTLGEEDCSCALVEPSVLGMSMVHLDLAGSPSQGESWLAFKRLLACVSIHKALSEAVFSPSCQGLDEQVQGPPLCHCGTRGSKVLVTQQCLT